MRISCPSISHSTHPDTAAIPCELQTHPASTDPTINSERHTDGLTFAEHRQQQEAIRDAAHPLKEDSNNNETSDIDIVPIQTEPDTTKTQATANPNNADEPVTPLDDGPCIFGCTTTTLTRKRTGRQNWESISRDSTWWGLPAGATQCHRHYLQGWRYRRRWGHGPQARSNPSAPVDATNSNTAIITRTINDHCTSTCPIPTPLPDPTSRGRIRNHH